MDLEIHRHYSLYPCNYIALDLLENAGVSSSTGSPGKTSFASHYTPSDVTRFEEYLSAQLAKIEIPNKDEAFLRERMLTMYANPLRNFLKAKE